MDFPKSLLGQRAQGCCNPDSRDQSFGPPCSAGSGLNPRQFPLFLVWPDPVHNAVCSFDPPLRWLTGEQ